MSLLVRTLRLCLALLTNFSQCFTSFPQLRDHVIRQNRLVFAEETDGHGRQLTSAMRFFIYEALALSGHNSNLVSDEENMNPQKITKDARKRRH